MNKIIDMKSVKMTEAEARKYIPGDIIDRLKNEPVDFTNRLTDCSKDIGYTEFSASIIVTDENGDERALTMYVLVDSDIVENSCLDDIDWDEAIDDAAYEIA